MTISFRRLLTADCFVVPGAARQRYVHLLRGPSTVATGSEDLAVRRNADPLEVEWSLVCEIDDEGGSLSADVLRDRGLSRVFVGFPPGPVASGRVAPKQVVHAPHLLGIRVSILRSLVGD